VVGGRPDFQIQRVHKGNPGRRNMAPGGRKGWQIQLRIITLKGKACGRGGGKKPECQVREKRPSATEETLVHASFRGNRQQGKVNNM